MKKITYICNRCNQEIRTEMARIGMELYDVLADKLEGITFPDNDIHFCIGCTKKIMEEILRPPEAEDEGSPEAAPDFKKKKTSPDIKPGGKEQA